MDDPHRLEQLNTVSGLHDQRLETLANAVEDLTAHLAATEARLVAMTLRVMALESQVTQLETRLRQDQKGRS